MSKASFAVEVDGKSIPPPCLWIMPERVGYEAAERSEFNWQGGRRLLFPGVLFSAFGIDPTLLQSYEGYVGFARRARYQNHYSFAVRTRPLDRI